jgi:tetratricopeptide (TPR) repeat protein
VRAAQLPHRLSAYLAFPLMTMLLAGAIVAQLDVENRWTELRAQPALHDYVLPGAVLRKLSMGQNGLLADIYWTRAVQYFGSQRLAHSTNYSMLKPLIDTAVELDPQLLVAYYAGAFFLATPQPRGAGRPDMAVDLLKRGIKANPDYWRFWHHLGFTYYWELGDYQKAYEAYVEGSKNPKAHPWMKTMAAGILAKGGNRETSRLMWMEILNSTEDETIRVNARNKLMFLKAQDDVEALDRVIQTYRKRENRPPGNFRDLIAAGLLRDVPVDPMGIPYVLEPGGRVAINPKSYLATDNIPSPPNAAASRSATITSE